ncbi:MAG: peptidylprolyl isomerase [Pseudomonadota bacterium]
MLKRLSATCAVALMMALPSHAQDTTADTVVATVNGTDITLGHMIAARARLPQEYTQLPPDVLFQGILDQLIQQTAIADGVENVSKAAELTLENERRALIVGETLTGIATAALTEEALEQAYQATYAGAEPEEEYNAAHILVETEETATGLLTEIRDGADFAEMAREHSTGPSGPNGGDLGWFGKGMMVPEFEAAVVALEPGAVSEPVQTQFGWHLVKLNETRQKDAPTLEEVRGELVEQIQSAAITAAVDAATEAADVTRADVAGIDPGILNDTSLLED